MRRQVDARGVEAIEFLGVERESQSRPETCSTARVAADDEAAWSRVVADGEGYLVSEDPEVVRTSGFRIV
jgi:hypothetical protein